LNCLGEPDPAVVRDRVLHVTDLHFWRISWSPRRLVGKRLLGMINLRLRRRRIFDLSGREQMAETLAREGAPTVIAGGDFSTTSMEEEFQQACSFLKTLESMGLKVYAIPGNHDVYTFTAVRRRSFEQHLGAFMPGERLPARVLLPGGTPVVFVPGARPNVLSSRGDILPKDIAETARLVKEAPPGPVLVVGHYPLLFRTDAYAQRPLHRLGRAEILRAALGKTGRTILYLAGHVHRFSETRDPRHPNLTHVTTNALFYRGRGGYTVVECAETGFRVTAKGM
jgi:3',5'-cyclic AMP phosphodiesterase CpdA